MRKGKKMTLADKVRRLENQLVKTQAKLDHAEEKIEVLLWAWITREVNNADRDTIK